MIINYRTAGFTLIELIIVIVVLSILGTMTTSYIRIGSQLYTHHVDLDASLNDVRFVAERLRRDMTSALGNSIIVQGNCVSYVPVIADAFYGEDFPLYPKTAQRMTISKAPAAIVGSFAVVNISSSKQLLAGSDHLHLINAYLTKQSELLFEQPVSFSSASATQRIYFIKERVEYCFREQQLYKKVDDGEAVLMADNITGNFTYQDNQFLNIHYQVLVDEQEMTIEQSVYIDHQP